MVRDPRMVFEQLFGSGGTPEQRAAAARDRPQHPRHADRARWPACAARWDRPTGSAWISTRTNIREIEQRIARIEARNTSGEARELPGAPAGVPDSFDEHVKLMFDLQVLAFSSDTTRVFSFKFGRDGSGRVYPGSGVDRGFHDASHHGTAEERIRQFGEINKYHVSLLPYFLEKLQSTMDGEANLLDKTLIALRIADGRRQHAQPSQLPADPARPRRRRRSRAASTSRRRRTRRWPTSCSRCCTGSVSTTCQTFGDSTGEFSFSGAGDNRGAEARRA